MQEQLDFVTAENKRQDGMRRAIFHAEIHHEKWGNRAFILLDKFVKQTTGPFMAEQARVWAENRGLVKPPSKRAWGAVMVKAARFGMIRSDGYAKTENPLAHRTPAAVWIKK